MAEFEPTHTDTDTEGGITAYECVKVDVPINDIVRHYLTCAEFTDCNSDHDNEGEDTDGSDILFSQAKGWSKQAVDDAASDCDGFMAMVESKRVDGTPLLEAYHEAGGSDEQMGHDFWLTRNGHGAGFWDRGLGATGAVLTEIAKSFSDVSVYVGDDALLYFQ